MKVRFIDTKEWERERRRERSRRTGGRDTHASGKVPNKEGLSSGRSQRREGVAIGSGAYSGARCDPGGSREHCFLR